MSDASANVLIINGHPDAHSRGLCHALAESYAAGAREKGRTVHMIDVAPLRFGFLTSQADFEKGQVSGDIAHAQDELLWADHVVFVFPLWLGDIPAVLKAFFEQTLRPGFAFTHRPSGLPLKHLTGRSARIIVTMGMPGLVYRWFFGAHGVKNLKRNILGFVGISPVRSTIVGSVGTRSKDSIAATIEAVRDLGRAGS